MLLEELLNGDFPIFIFIDLSDLTNDLLEQKPSNKTFEKIKDGVEKNYVSF